MRTIFAPSKMVSPSLSARIVQRGHLSRFRVNRFNPIEFEAIACGTGQTEVFLGRYTAFGSRYDVVDLTQLPTQPFSGLAVFTSVVRTLTHQTDQTPRESICRHRRWEADRSGWAIRSHAAPGWRALSRAARRHDRTNPIGASSRPSQPLTGTAGPPHG